MITNIIFSKNRACQLHALLSSLDEYAEGVFRNKVIYTYDKEYAKGYEIIKELHPNTVFIKEERLKLNVLSQMDSEFTSFMVDDQIMFKPPPEIPLEGLRKSVDSVFSLRLGKNISEPHLSYPLSVDGHIFLTRDIKPLIESTAFNNPNQLESRLQRSKYGWDLSYNFQCMISIPHNRVSTKSRCKFSGMYTEELLEKYFVEGKEIDYNKMDFNKLTNVHAVIPYAFRAR